MTGVKQEETTSPFEGANKILEGARDKYPVVMIVGLNGDDLIDIASNVPRFADLQWMLNKASFKLFEFEDKAIEARNKQKQEKEVA